MFIPNLFDLFYHALNHASANSIQSLVSMYLDRLEILSYGGLPGKETKEDFFKGISNTLVYPSLINY
jgi:hypothetical protein